jgi:hypothetical protein
MRKRAKQFGMTIPMLDLGVRGRLARMVPNSLGEGHGPAADCLVGRFSCSVVDIRLLQFAADSA